MPFCYRSVASTTAKREHRYRSRLGTDSGRSQRAGTFDRDCAQGSLIPATKGSERERGLAKFVLGLYMLVGSSRHRDDKVTVAMFDCFGI